MEKKKWLTPKRIVLLAVILVLAVAVAVLVIALTGRSSGGILEIPTDEEYVYVNPDETKAETDPGMKIDGVLDEDAYQNSKWLYLQNDGGGNNVNIAMTSYFGEQGMYIVFDVTESVPIYVNLERAPYLNSCVELYLAPSHLTGVQENGIFEIDLLPTGDLTFKKSNGKYGYENVASTNDIMACLGAVTKGGPVNTPECYGYSLELFIPWDYMEWLDMDVDSMKNGFVYINPAHITSNNFAGTDINLDRYWYHYAQKLGADFTDVPQYFRFNRDGIMGTSEITLESGEHHKISGSDGVLPGMKTPVTITPDEGYALTSIQVDGQEQIHNVDFSEDGSVTLWVRGTGIPQTVTAQTEAVSSGSKTLSGKLRVNGILGDGLQGVLVTYMGPQGEKPVELDAEGNFELKDLEQGYYVLKVEKEGYATFTRSIYLNRDTYTELTLKSQVFYTTRGACWILDDESMGILYKTGGAGHVMSHASYEAFTFETYIKYDLELAKLSDGDNYKQQRSGVRILFSNGKYWHIDLMLEGEKFVVQYAKHAGDNSIFNWQNVHVLTEEQISKYTSPEGIKLTIMRQENRAAICLDDQVLFIEELADEYASMTAQMGMEAWIANSTVMKVPFKITPSATVEKVPKPLFYAAQTWDITSQHDGIVRKFGVAGNTTWLDSTINCNDVTTLAKDLSPSTNDYSMIYIFRFSNGEQFRVRLNHTDNDGKYCIQSMAGSTVFDAWKNHYTLTDQQAEKVKNQGISYRVLISGTTAHVFLDGQEVCTYDLSKVVATGRPSGIEKATVKVSLRLDGNLDRTTEIPFKLEETIVEVPEEPDQPVDPANKVEIVIPQMENGMVETVKAEYAVGSTVTLTVTPATGYVQKLTLNGQPLLLDPETGKYTFVATEKTYTIAGGFVPYSVSDHWSEIGKFDFSDIAYGVVYAPAVSDNWGSGWLVTKNNSSEVGILVKDYSHGAQHEFAGAISFKFSNGKELSVRLIYWKDEDKYVLQTMNCDFSPWTKLVELTEHKDTIMNGDGVWFTATRTGTKVDLSINGTVVHTIDLSTAGITDSTTCVARLRSYNFAYGAQMYFEVKTDN